MDHFPRQLVVANIVGLATHPAGSALDCSEGFGQKIVETLPTLLIALHKLSRLGTKLRVGERLVFELDGVNTLDDRLTPFQVFIVVTTREFLENGGDHETY
jgi:hypothetical protein